jgi:endogenous inhibitor of DNA gyrase (YacG/DUF329 family)
VRVMDKVRTDTTLEPRLVRCPGCGGNSVYGPSNAYRPFCSERCKQMDLGAWASESFKVESSEPGRAAGPEQSA